ncbi:unnamed protein product [Strongylus vulgaris]|uniref:Uncharacterized protein n=1 Tax=Strongylus vulgaris TaxID=40348 RepID=A0A3P7J5U8_STRVU|nr:unnamed protein product [Strongylus vulgaris]
MADQEYRDCVDFGRFANQHMLAVTGEGVRLVPEIPCLPPYPSFAPGLNQNSITFKCQESFR